jgi:hypothetical protein
VLSLVAAAPAAASAPGVDEYQLNLPNGGGDGGSSTPEQTTPAPTTTTPVTPTVPVAPTVTPTTTVPSTTVPVAPVKPHKRKPHHAVVLGSTSVNAKLGPEQSPSLKVRGDEGGTPWLPIGIAVGIAACCLIAVWRLRYLRELPTAPRPEAAPAPRSRPTPSSRTRRPAAGATSGS